MKPPGDRIMALSEKENLEYAINLVVRTIK